jgi:translation initiation factor IF-2
MASEKEAREVAARRKEAAKDRELRQKRHITLEQLHEQIESGEFHELKLIIKGDVDGSIEAIASSLERLSTPEVKINIISSGVGAVKEADIHLASSSHAIIVAFQVLPAESVRQMAEDEGVLIKYHRVIYDVVSDIKDAMEGMLTPDIVEEVTGEAKILKLFKVPKVGTIAGCLVNSGTVDRDSRVHVFRDGIEIAEAKVSSLKRHKDDVKSVRAGLECGIGVEGVKDILEGDVLGFFKKVEVAKKLTTSKP